ncbi:hypothetical protein BDV12DRAFT_162009 [Aspergillus spectabilis]
MVQDPIVGGGFSQSSVGWRWAFYIGLLVGAACAPVYLFLFPNIDPCRGAQCIFAIIVNGAAMSAFGLYMPWYTVGGALFYIAVTTNPAAKIYGSSAITSLGGGMYLQTAFSVAQASVEREKVADASSSITFS